MARGTIASGAMEEQGHQAPETVSELQARARAMAGRTLGELAAECGLEVPPDLRRHKGWVGNLIERVLGADAGSRALPDFAALGIELKTLPIDNRGRPSESTYVCTVPLTDLEGLIWEGCWTRRKLERVLWVPIQADKRLELGQRMVGSALLWSPDRDEAALMQRDWEAHMAIIRDGGVDEITAHAGRVLQIRPKGADSRQRVWAEDPHGEFFLTLPRGFYLRSSFTAEILSRHYAG